VSPSATPDSRNIANSVNKARISFFMSFRLSSPQHPQQVHPSWLADQNDVLLEEIGRGLARMQTSGS
jgi:hypothetical protein